METMNNLQFPLKLFVWSWPDSTVSSTLLSLLKMWRWTFYACPLGPFSTQYTSTPPDSPTLCSYWPHFYLFIFVPLPHKSSESLPLLWSRPLLPPCLSSVSTILVDFQVRWKTPSVSPSEPILCIDTLKSLWLNLQGPLIVSPFFYLQPNVFTSWVNPTRYLDLRVVSYHWPRSLIYSNRSLSHPFLSTELLGFGLGDDLVRQIFSSFLSREAFDTTNLTPDLSRKIIRGTTKTVLIRLQTEPLWVSLPRTCSGWESITTDLVAQNINT